MNLEQKKAIMGIAIRQSSDILLKAFVECEVKNDIQANCVDKDTGDIYQINFAIVKKNKNPRA